MLRIPLPRLTRHTWVTITCAAVAGLALHGAGLGGRQATPQNQQPRFRAAANFVQVDVYPSKDERPVGDLSKDDFEVLEDGVPQSVATFEHVSARPTNSTASPVEPRTLSEERDLIGDPRNRLFVVFVDTYHVTDPTSWHDGRLRLPGSTTTPRPPEKKPSPRDIDRAIVNFLEKSIGPNDLVAPMSPDLDPRQMVFGRRPERFAEWLNTVWGRRFSWDDLDPEEERWERCYPSDDVGDPYGCYRGILEEMVLRRRESLTLKALEATVDRLGQLREGRKAVLLVSEGWQMFRPNPQLARELPPISVPGCKGEAPSQARIFVGPGGKPQSGNDPQNPNNIDRHECDSSRLQLAQLDDERDYRRLLDRANRDTVTFYPIDPRGLAVFDKPFTAAPPGSLGDPGPSLNPITDYEGLRGRLETLRTLAGATDGFMTETNNLAAGMKKIADDLSEYYLLGYNSTNSKLDGKFRKITVHVKRPGVQVRARRGYLAPTEAEISLTATPPPPKDPVVRLRETALTSLGTASLDRVMRLTSGYDWRKSPDSEMSSPLLWAVVELGESAARQPEWRDGGDAVVTITDADGSVVASGRGRLSAASRSFAWSSADQRLGVGEYRVGVTARPASGTAGAAAEQMKVSLPGSSVGAATPPGTPRVFRRGPFTGAAYVQTADANFRRVERIRVSISLGPEPTGLSARVLDRRGQTLAVPVTTEAREQDGQRVALAEVTLASLAPGDYLIEVMFGGGTPQTIVLAFRIVP